MNDRADDALLLHLLDQCVRAEGVQIFIGQESGYGLLDDLSLVTAPYAVDDEVVGIATLLPAYEGGPGRAHGGMVAAIFDDITGYVLRIAQTAAFTGTLTVRYHKPTPMEVPLTFRARLVGREDRRLFITADCRHGDALISSCEATYITIDPSVFA